LNPRRSELFLRLIQRIAGNADEVRAAQQASRARPVPAAFWTDSQAPETSPDRVPVIACGEHKILCRGQKPNYGVRERQASLHDFVTSFLSLFFKILRHYVP
jgi:hypothetical protein